MFSVSESSSTLTLNANFDAQLAKCIASHWNASNGCGPWRFEGRYFQSDFETWGVMQEGPWRFSWTSVDSTTHGVVEMWGDPSGPHQMLTQLVNRQLMHEMSEYLGLSGNSGQPGYDALTKELKLKRLIRDCAGVGQQWEITRSSSTAANTSHTINKEPDGLLRPRRSNVLHAGIVTEIAYKNESFPRLVHEIEDWVSGHGARASLAIGVKWQDCEKDPYLTLIVATNLTDVVTYPFGRESSVSPAAEEYDDICHPPAVATVPRLDNAPNPDPHAVTMSPLEVRHADTVALPVGQALFASTSFNTDKDRYSPEYVEYLRNMVVTLDLRMLRRDCLEYYA